MPPSTKRALAIILAAGAALRLVPIWFGLPYQARPDEETSIGRAFGILNGDLNPHYFIWPSVTLYLFAAVIGIFSAVRGMFTDAHGTFATYALVTRGFVALAGTATILVLFRLAQRIAGDRVALLAAAFLAVAILHVRESHFAMTDVIMTLLLWMSLALVIRVAYMEDTERGVPAGAVRWCALAGLVGGLAVSTKYSAAPVAAAMAAVQLLWLWRQPGLALSWRAWLPVAAFAAALLAGFCLGTPYAILDYAKFSEDLRFNFEHLAAGHAPERETTHLGRGWIYHAKRSLPYGVGVAAFVAALAGMVPFARHYGRAAFVLGVFGAGFYLAIGNGYTVFFRYVLPLIPLLCLFAAAGVHHVSEALARRVNLSPVRALTVVAAATLLPGLVYSAWLDLLLARTDTRVLASGWINARMKPHDTLHDTGNIFTRLDLGRTDIQQWRFDPETRSFGDPGGRSPDWLVLYESPLVTYMTMPAEIVEIARTQYSLMHTVRGTQGRARSAVYDLHDAFFLPVSRFTTILRPGPNIRIYRRRDLPHVLPEARTP